MWINLRRTIESRVQRSGFPFLSWALDGNGKKNKIQFNKNSEQKCPVVQLHSCQLNFCIPIVLNFSHIFLNTYLQINLFCFPAKSWVDKKDNAAFSHPEKEFFLSFGYWWIKSRTPLPTFHEMYYLCEQVQGSYQGRPLCYLYKSVAFY